MERASKTAALVPVLTTLNETNKHPWGTGVAHWVGRQPCTPHGCGAGGPGLCPTRGPLLRVSPISDQQAPP